MKVLNTKPFSQRKKQGGFIAAEFIFAIMIAAGISIVFFAINFTMSMAEVAQYIAFSTARAYAAADVTIADQEANGRGKFNSLLNKPAIRGLFNNPDGGWFKLTNLELRGDSSSNFDSEYSESRIPQSGIRFKFTPKLLNLRIPLIGNTTTDGEDYGATINGLIIREPSQEECKKQVQARYDTIVTIDSRFSDLAKDTSSYMPLEDNGC